MLLSRRITVDWFILLVEIAAGITTIIATAMLFIRPLKKRALEMQAERDGWKCLLRAKMLETYYKNLEAKTVRQYEFENFLHMYNAYKAMGGNSFIDQVHEEVTSWQIVS
jgi:hypothetical protein